MRKCFIRKFGGEMMEISINIEDYLSKEEIKEIAKEQISYVIQEKFRKENDIECIITNLSYGFLFKAVSEAIGKDSLDMIKDKVVELLMDDSNIRYLLWRKKDAWENEESPAVTIMNQAIKDNHSLIESKVYGLIDNYDFNEAKDEIYDILCDAISKQLFGK